MKELKLKLIDLLCLGGYSLESATEQIQSASILIKGNNITVTYKNGVNDHLIYDDNDNIKQLFP